MSLNTPKVSVVMAAYNAEKYLKEAVDSILNQTFEDFEFIIVNAGSTDGTQTILDSYQDLRMVIINDHYIGRSEARNKAIKLSKGGYIAIMDADDIALPERLEREVKFMDRHKEIAIVGGYYFFINENGKMVGIDKVLTESDEIKERLPIANTFGHSTVMVRKSCFEYVGGYREELKGAEDYDLFLRLSESFKLANLKEPLCKWRINPSSFSLTNKNELDRYARLVRELAKERREFGKDRLQLFKEDGNEKDLNELLPKAKPQSRKEKAQGYYSWGAILLAGNDYIGGFKLLLKSFLNNPLHMDTWVRFVEGLIFLFFPTPLSTKIINKLKPVKRFVSHILHGDDR
jgi:glycosyltransferase involved in cell wall biosynthesis